MDIFRTIDIVNIYHFALIITITVSWHLKSLATQMFVPLIFRLTTKKSSKYCITSPLWGDSTGDQWIPWQKVSSVGRITMLWYHIVFYGHWLNFIVCYYTPAQRSCWGVYWFHSVCPSVCPSVRPSIRPTSCVRSVVPTVLVGSIWYLYILSSNFWRCVVCIVSYKISKSKFLAIFLDLWLWLCLVLT